MVPVTLAWEHALQMLLALSQRRNALKAGIAAGRLTDDEAWDAACDAGDDLFHGVRTNYGGAYLTIGPAEIVVHE